MRFFNIIQGVFVRVMFTVSSILSVWRVVSTTSISIYWLILFFNIVLYAEAGITFTQRKSGEWKWFCPSVLIYQLMTVPCVWILEIKLLNDRVAASGNKNSTLIGTCADSDDVFNVSTFKHVSVKGVELYIPLELPEHLWSLALQQVLLFVLIIGRWMLPKGELTRDQLSQLLLVYIGIAADILEFSTEGLKMEETRCNTIMVYWILAIWTWSLLQFTLGLTVTKSRKPRMATASLEPRMNIMCCETEVWGIMATVVMQDGPFLALRLYVLVQFEAINQMMIFFTAKNTLVILLQLYRLMVIFLKKPGHDPNSILGRINRYRHPGMRYHSGNQNGHGSRGMPSERDRSTTKLLSLDVEAANTPNHRLPLLPTDLPLDGPFRHSVNMSRPEEYMAHTPMNPERFPPNDTSFILGRTLPNDVIPIQNANNLGVCDSPNHSCSDYENMNTPYGSVPNENDEDEPLFMVPDFPELPSVFDSDDEPENIDDEATEAQEANGDINDNGETDKKGGKKKGKKKKDKKEKDEKKKEEKKKKDEKKKEEEKKKEDKKKEEQKKKDEKRKEEERKKEEKRALEDKKKVEKRKLEEKKKSMKESIKEDKRKESKKQKDKDDSGRRGSISSTKGSIKEDKRRDSKKKGDKKKEDSGEDEKKKDDETIVEEDEQADGNIKENTVEENKADDKADNNVEIGKAEGGNIADDPKQMGEKNDDNVDNIPENDQLKDVDIKDEKKDNTSNNDTLRKDKTKDEKDRKSDDKSGPSKKDDDTEKEENKKIAKPPPLDQSSTRSPPNSPPQSPPLSPALVSMDDL